MNRDCWSAPIVRTSLALATAFALAIAAPATEALARGRGAHRRARVVPSRAQAVHHRVPARVAPAPAYRPSPSRQVYGAPRRHPRVVYRVPVVVGGIVSCRPYVGCGATPLPVAVAPSGGEGWLSIGVRLPGLSIAARLPFDD